MSQNATGCIAALCILVLTAAPLTASELPRGPLATFPGGEVTRADLEARFLELCSSPEAGQVVCSTLLDWKMRSLEAARLGLSVPRATVDARLEALALNSGGQERIREQMRRSGLHWYAPWAWVEDALLLEAIVRQDRKLAAEAAVSPDDYTAALEALKIRYAPEFSGFGARRIGSVGTTDLLVDDLVEFLCARADPEFLRVQTLSVLSDRQVLAELAKRKLALAPLDFENAVARKRRLYEQEQAARGVRAPLTLEQHLARQGRTLEAWKRDLSLQALAARMKLVAPDLGDAALGAYYETVRDRFLIVRVSQILIAFQPDNPYQPGTVTDERRASAQERAEAALAALKSLPGFPQVTKEGFAALAAERSDCPSKARGGDIGYLAALPQMAYALPPAAYSLDVLVDEAGNTASPIIPVASELARLAAGLADGAAGGLEETPAGYHLLRREAGRYPKDWKSVREILYEMQLGEKSAALELAIAKSYPAEFRWAPWKTKK